MDALPPKPNVISKQSRYCSAEAFAEAFDGVGPDVCLAVMSWNCWDMCTTVVVEHPKVAEVGLALPSSK